MFRALFEIQLMLHIWAEIGYAFVEPGSSPCLKVAVLELHPEPDDYGLFLHSLIM
jgi:hypothetical protein